jgi:hypothetical protein
VGTASSDVRKPVGSPGFRRTIPDATGAEWAIDCVNCDAAFSATPFDGAAFCSARCHDTERAVRYGRKQRTQYGPAGRWPDAVLAAALERVPAGNVLAEIERRWMADKPARPCDDVQWNDSFQTWIAHNRRKLPLVVLSDH